MLNIQSVFVLNAIFTVLSLCCMLNKLSVHVLFCLYTMYVYVLYVVGTVCYCVVCYIYSLVSPGGSINRIHRSDHHFDSRGYML